MNRDFRIVLLLLINLFFIACNNQNRYEINGWEIGIDTNNGTINLSNSQLGTVLTGIKLFANKNTNENLTNLLVEQNDSVLILTSTNTKTTWTITVLENGIDFSSSANNAFVNGIAPAPKRRIPARTAEQDNDVIYMQMGFVSATNIHNLFDMDSDFMIHFSNKSLLKRDRRNNTLMHVFIPVEQAKEITLIANYYDNVIGISKHSAISNNSYNNVTITPESVRDIEKDSSNVFIPYYTPISGRFKTAPTGWSSWYCYYMYPTEATLFAETKAISEKLKPYGLKYIQLDAAYTRTVAANWLNWNKELYPSGGKAWFKYVRENGLVPGLWMNVYGENYENPSMAGKYPDNFFLKNNGKLTRACCSSDSTVSCLDYSNPAVFEKHLKPLMDTLINSWGLGYLKAGGGGKWMDRYEKNRKSAFNTDLKSREVYRKVLSTLRDKLGDNRYLLGCSLHEIGVGFGYFDGSRSGLDDYANWDGENHASTGMQAFFNTVFTNAYLNGIVWWTDPDDVMIRDPLTMDEGKTIVSTISLSGQAYILSDYIADFTDERKNKFLHSKYDINWAKNYPELVKPLQEEKLELYKKTLPAMPIRAMDLFPYKTEPKFFQLAKHFPKAIDLKVNAATGMYDVVAVYNWHNTDTLKSVNLYSDLGLEKDISYVAFDFWNSNLVAVNRGAVELSIPKHGTRALIIRPISVYPFLMATSRHITSAYSVKEYDWDASGKLLHGKSENVPGDEYTLYFYVPDKFKTSEIKLEASVDAILKNLEPNLIAVTFKSNNNSIDWKLRFIQKL